MNKKLPLQQEAASEEIKQMLAGNHSKHQCVRMLQALWLFKLNTFEARRSRNVYHLPADILQLRQQGYEIDTIGETVKAGNSIKHHVDCYVHAS